MSIDITVTSNLDKRLKKIAKKTSDKEAGDMMFNLAAAQLDRIMDRTERGIDYNKKKFAPLEDSDYKWKKREKTGRDADLRGFGPGTRMLDDITIKQKNREATIRFITAEKAKIAMYHNEGTNTMRKRKFFAVSKQDRKEITTQLQRYLQEMLK